MALRDKASVTSLFIKRLARRFHAARRGNIALMTALLMMPIMGLMGLSVDYGNALFVKSRLDQSAQAAATAAATAARNWTQAADRSLAGYNQNSIDTRAGLEGSSVGSSVFDAQLGTIVNGNKGSPTVTVSRLGNTYTAQVQYNATLNTYFAHLFGVNVFNLRGQRSIIIGLVDTPAPSGSTTPTAVIDETWVTTSTSVNNTPSRPVVNDWYSGTAGTSSPLSTTDGPTVGGAPSGRMQVGDPSGSIAPILSKKVYLPAGNYELRYWYQSTVVYPEYEPAYICGSVEGEMHWVTSSTTRALGSSPNSAIPFSGAIISNAQSARAGVYMTPVLGNPQLDTTAPLASAFPRPPRLPFNGGTDRADNSKNRIDICTYSSRWIQRSVPITITVAGYFWLSFVAEPPTTTTTINGFYLGPLQLCKDACTGPLNNNWPWTYQTSLFEDDFGATTNDPYAVAGQPMDARSGIFPSSAKYEQTPTWLFRAFGGLNSAYPLDNLPLFTYASKTDSRGNVSYFANAQRSSTFMFRKILLVPGVYRANFTVEIGDPTYAPGTVSPNPGYYCSAGSGRMIGGCGCYVGAVDFAITHFDQLTLAGLTQAALDTTIRSTVSGYYYNPSPEDDPNFTPDPLTIGSIIQTCVKSSSKRTVTVCFLVPRTAYYGFTFRNAGPPIDTSPSGTGAQQVKATDLQRWFPDIDPSDLTLGAGGARLYSLKMDVLSQGVKNSRNSDFATYGTDCSAGASASLGNVMTAGTPVWPGLTVPPSAYGTPPARLTVKAPLQ